jgi:hypothetical protein
MICCDNDVCVHDAGRRMIVSTLRSWAYVKYFSITCDDSEYSAIFSVLLLFIIVYRNVFFIWSRWLLLPASYLVHFVAWWILIFTVDWFFVIYIILVDISINFDVTSTYVVRGLLWMHWLIFVFVYESLKYACQHITEWFE